MVVVPSHTGGNVFGGMQTAFTRPSSMSVCDVRGLWHRLSAGGNLAGRLCFHPRPRARAALRSFLRWLMTSFSKLFLRFTSSWYCLRKKAWAVPSAHSFPENGRLGRFNSVSLYIFSHSHSQTRSFPITQAVVLTVKQRTYGFDSQPICASVLRVGRSLPLLGAPVGSPPFPTPQQSLGNPV
jgi:hypothetical protein